MGRLLLRPPMFLVLLGFSSLAILLPASSQAQVTNYSTFLYGDRVQGMGGAATGVASEASASFYNPGGLAFQRRASASASVSLTAITKVTIDDGFSTEIGDADLVYEFNGSVPLFVGIVKKLGEEETYGVGRHALSVSVVTFGGADRAWQASIQDSEVNGLARLTVARSDRSTFYGLSYAFLANEHFGFGLTTYLALRDFSHSENILLRILNQPSEPGVYPDAQGASRTTNLVINAEVLMFRLGALWNVDGRLRLGAMFQPPGITLGARADVSELEQGVGIEEGGAFRFIETSADDLGAEQVTPWAMRFGVSYLFDDNFIGAFDVSIWGPAGSADDPIQQWEDPPPEEGQPRPPNAGFYVSQYYYREVVVNAYLGFEWTIRDRFPLRWGFLTNFSAVPEIEGTSETYDNSHINEFGATLAFAVRDEGYDVGLGIIGLIGSGTARQLDLEALTEQEADLYRPADVSTWTIYFTISGAVGAVKDLAGGLIGGDGDAETPEGEGDDGADPAETPESEGEGEADPAEASEGEGEGEADPAESSEGETPTEPEEAAPE